MERSEAEDFGRALGEFVNALSERDKECYRRGFDAGLERAAEIARRNAGEECNCAYAFSSLIRAEREKTDGTA